MARRRRRRPPELAVAQLRRTCNAAGLDFETTAELDGYAGVLGQPRAMAAVDFGIRIQGDGYNLFAIGPQGLGKHSLLREVLSERAAGEPVPPDLCYVNNFDDPQKPRLLALPAGRGAALKRDLDELIEEITAGLSAAFEGEDYQSRRQLLDQEMGEQQERAVTALDEEAQRRGLSLVRTPMGIVFAPTREGEILSPEDFQRLPDDERRRLTAEVDRLQEDLKRLFRKVPRLQRERRDKLRDLARRVSQATVGPLVEELRHRWADAPAVGEMLASVERDMIDNARALAGAKAQRPSPEGDGGATGGEPSLARRYAVNVLVDHGGSTGAPVVYEDSPSYQALLGRIEHLQRMGALVTDFGLIRPGALHRANGGYLVLDADRLLQQGFAWPALKRALRSRELKMESLGQALGLLPTSSLEPEPVPLAVKVVLVGDRFLYYLLSTYDPDFPELFKVAADFDDQMEWSPQGERAYAQLLARLLRDHRLRPFDRGAVAAVIEQSARLLGDGGRLALYMSRVLDLLREADHFAGLGGRAVVTAADVERAVEERVFRSDRVRARTQEEIQRGTVLIATAGARVGQVNGLSVLQLGEFSFGRPSRITARVRLGSGEVVNIEREVELSGPLHSKGVLILAGFLGARYAADLPLSLTASLVFEQSYGGVDGDSASSAELYALLSAIAGLPLAQGLAVTGSVNQHGEVQAIGGANEKIEGFFDVCAARGLDGRQGVLIPASNVQHLMLHRRVLDAVAAGRFHIYPVATIDEGIEILTGLPSGEPGPDGEYPEGTVNRHVRDRLREMAQRRRRFADTTGEEAAGEGI